MISAHPHNRYSGANNFISGTNIFSFGNTCARAKTLRGARRNETDRASRLFDKFEKLNPFLSLDVVWNLVLRVEELVVQVHGGAKTRSVASVLRPLLFDLLARLALILWVAARPLPLVVPLVEASVRIKLFKVLAVETRAGHDASAGGWGVPGNAEVRGRPAADGVRVRRLVQKNSPGWTRGAGPRTERALNAKRGVVGVWRHGIENLLFNLCVEYRLIKKK